MLPGVTLPPIDGSNTISSDYVAYTILILDQWVGLGIADWVKVLVLSLMT